MERIVLKHLSGSKANQVEEFPLNHVKELVLGRGLARRRLRVRIRAVVELEPGSRPDLVGRALDLALDEEAVLEAPLELRRAGVRPGLLVDRLAFLLRSRVLLELVDRLLLLVDLSLELLDALFGGLVLRARRSGGYRCRRRGARRAWSAGREG